MKRFCQEQGVPFEECGKLVVATTPEEVPRLEQLHQRGIANGVPGLLMLEPEQFRQIRAALQWNCGPCKFPRPASWTTRRWRRNTPS